MHRTCAGEWTFLTGLDECWPCSTRSAVPRFNWCTTRIILVGTGDGQHASGLMDRWRSFIWPMESCPVIRNKRDAFGEGEIPLVEILAAFNRAGYDGDYDVELVGPDLELPTTANSCHTRGVRTSN